MALTHLSLTDFRNYRLLAVDIDEAGMVIHGANGSGKTNLLESIHLLCTGRSQRHAARREMIAFNAEVSVVEGTFFSHRTGMPLRASIGFDREKKIALQRNGQPVRAFSEWLGMAAVLSFGPEDIALVTCAPAQRRGFCDMLICQLDPLYCAALGRYKKNMLQKNFLLAHAREDDCLALYEQQMAEAGAFIALKRA
ncbi:MAG: AAA family ATPase, partial [Chitinivibrionales bacterium]|nr:AAA family ATPase [Chitinivibrionales bacterium]